MSKDWDKAYDKKRSKELKVDINKTDQHLENGDLGMFNISRRAKAELLKMEGDINKSLMVYLESLFISANGPTNHGTFDKRRGGLAIGNINTVKNIIDDLGFGVNEVHKLFIAVATPVHHQLSTPLDPQDLWHEKIKGALFEK